MIPRWGGKEADRLEWRRRPGEEGESPQVSEQFQAGAGSQEAQDRQETLEEEWREVREGGLEARRRGWHTCGPPAPGPRGEFSSLTWHQELGVGPNRACSPGESPPLPWALGTPAGEQGGLGGWSSSGADGVQEKRETVRLSLASPEEGGACGGAEDTLGAFSRRGEQGACRLLGMRRTV